MKHCGASYTWQSDKELKTLKWLAYGALEAESNILEIKGSHASSNRTQVGTSLHSEKVGYGAITFTVLCYTP